MTIYAKQVPPEFQESPFFRDEPDLYGCMIFGNRDYYSHGMDALEAVPVDVLDDHDDRPETLAALLTEYTGRVWTWGTLRGCCQGDWQYIVFRPDLWPEGARLALEMEYFNLGTEWMVSTDVTDEMSLYCYGWNAEKIAEEIRDAFGGSPADAVQLDWFDGYIQTPKYRGETV